MAFGHCLKCYSLNHYTADCPWASFKVHEPNAFAPRGTENIRFKYKGHTYNFARFCVAGEPWDLDNLIAAIEIGKVPSQPGGDYEIPKSTRQQILDDISDEVLRAEKHEKNFTSMHECYGVLLEEVDEVWELTKLKKRDRDPAKIREELIQVAAMAVKGIESIDNFHGGKV